MKNKIIRRNLRVILYYLVFGGLTTLVNVFIYWLCSHVFLFSVIYSTVVAWIVAVSFAYFSNRKWVFYSQNNGFSGIVKEILMFFLCRSFTGFVDLEIMWLFATKFNFNDVIVKAVANVFVIVFNFLASKFLIFKNKSH